MEKYGEAAATVLRMDKQLRDDLLIKDGMPQLHKYWENTYIKKQICRRENGGVFSLKDHIRAMVYALLSSGASWNRLEDGMDLETGEIRPVDAIFYRYDAVKLLEADPDDILRQVMNQKLGTPYIRKQIHALIEVNIEKMLSLEKAHGSIDRFYQIFLEKDPTAKELVRELSTIGRPYKFAQLGEALTAEYLRNVGYDIAKPDRHIRRILGGDRLGCSVRKMVPVYEAFDIVSGIAKALGKRTAEVDFILWSYCAKGYGEICTARAPKCGVCQNSIICKTGKDDKHGHTIQ